MADKQQELLEPQADNIAEQTQQPEETGQEQTDETQTQETADNAAAVDTADNQTAGILSEQKEGESDEEYLERLGREANEKADEKENKSKTQKENKADSKTTAEPQIDLKKLTEIPNDIRERMKAKGFEVDRYKYLEDVFNSANEARKENGRLNNDVYVLKNRLALYEDELRKTQGQLAVYNNQNSENQNNEAAEQFRIDFEIDHVKAINNLISKNMGQAQQQQPQEYGGEQLPPEITAMRNEAVNTAQSDFSEITKGMEQADILKLNERLLEVSKEHPNITSLKTLKSLLDAKEILAEKKLADETAAKEKAKGAAAFVPNKSPIKQEGASGLIDKINNASSFEELERIEATMV